MYAFDSLYQSQVGLASTLRGHHDSCCRRSVLPQSRTLNSFRQQDQQQQREQQQNCKGRSALHHARTEQQGSLNHRFLHRLRDSVQVCYPQADACAVYTPEERPLSLGRLDQMHVFCHMLV